MNSTAPCGNDAMFFQQYFHAVYVKTMSEPKTEASLRLTQFSHGGG
jgi:hypothetical protein